MLVEVLLNVVVIAIKLLVVIISVDSVLSISSLLVEKLPISVCAVVRLIPSVRPRLVERLLIAVCVVDSIVSVTPLPNVAIVVDETKE